MGRKIAMKIVIVPRAEFRGGPCGEGVTTLFEDRRPVSQPHHQRRFVRWRSKPGREWMIILWFACVLIAHTAWLGDHSPRVGTSIKGVLWDRRIHEGVLRTLRRQGAPN